MPTPTSGQAKLEQEFLPIRAKILEIAASLDRIGRASGDLAQDSRLELLQAAIGKLLENEGDRAEAIQLLFSRPYDDQWKKTLELTTPKA